MTLALTSNLSSLALPTARGGSSSAGTNGAAGRDDARLKDALTALQSLKRPTSKASEEQKAAAAKKVEALKARIKMLRMSSGNPASTAKAVAALARELGAAVKAYAAAGGGSAAVGLQPTATPGPQDTGSAEAAEDAEATDETEAETGEGERTPAAAHPSDPYRKAQERLQADAAERARQNGSQEADAKFAAEAKGLAAELKAMLREAQQKAKRTGDDRAMSADQRTADKALDQVTDAVADLTSPIGSVGVGLSINV